VVSVDEEFTVSDLAEMGIVEDTDGKWVEEESQSDSLP